jgi:hypothetical protein
MKEQISREDFIGRAYCKNLEQSKKLKTAAHHHIDSFNYLYEEGL